MVDVTKRATAAAALTFPWLEQATSLRQQSVRIVQQVEIVAPGVVRPLTPPHMLPTATTRNLRFFFRSALLAVRFMCRIRNLKRLKRCVDRVELQKRPFRHREASLREPKF